MTDSVRVDWLEIREGELFFVIGEKSSGVWVFFERSSWELRWYPLQTSCERIQRADSMLSAVSARIAA